MGIGQNDALPSKLMNSALPHLFVVSNVCCGASSLMVKVVVNGLALKLMASIRLSLECIVQTIAVVITRTDFHQ